MEKHRGAALHWFQNGHSIRQLTQHEAVLGESEDAARSLNFFGYPMKRQGTAAIWKQRKTKTGETKEVNLQELKEQALFSSDHPRKAVVATENPFVGF